MRLGVLGGTFNPIHLGHLRAAEQVREALGLDEIVFVPSGNPPLKQAGLAEAALRYEMVRLATASNPAFSVSPLELQGQEKSYTYLTMEAMRALHPRDDLFFIMGTDAFLDLPMWREPLRLLRSADFAVMLRPGAPFSSLASSPYLGLGGGELGALDQGEGARLSVPLEGGRTAHLLGLRPLDISATAIRAMLAGGWSARYLLPGEVELFIMSHGLYRGR